MAAIRRLCNRGFLLKHGQLVADKTAIEAVNDYMAGMRERSLVREWDDEKTAPGNAVATLRRVRICDDNGKEINQIHTDDHFNIEITYKVIVDGASVGLNIIFYDSEGNCILASINNHESNWYSKPMPNATYKSICKIPKNLFNNDYFSLSLVLFGKNFSDAVVIDGVLGLQINDGAEVRGDYYGEYASRLRPSFQWVTEKEG
jgi:hypothetical protein